MAVSVCNPLSLTVFMAGAGAAGLASIFLAGASAFLTGAAFEAGASVLAAAARLSDMGLETTSALVSLAEEAVVTTLETLEPAALRRR